MDRQSRSISDMLSRAGAQLLRSGSVSRGLSLAEWRNDLSHARYDRPDHHTLSIYLAGGEKVVREDRRLTGGAPDKLCLLPVDHESEWQIGGPVRMFHLYIDPDILAYRALTAFDIDPRHIDLMDLTFSDDPAIAMIVKGGVVPLDWSGKGDGMALDSACHLLLHQMLRRYSRRADRAIVRGGLSPVARRRSVELIEAHLDEPLTLDQLAAAVGLSVFHFAKMFRTSLGMPPHRYLAERRVERAKQLLRRGAIGLAEIAQACGYASQSHFTRAFKAAIGLPPGEWRRLQ